MGCRTLSAQVLGSAFWFSLWVIPSLCSSADWSQYRGPNGQGVSQDHITTNWTASVTNPLWRVRLTNGISSLTVAFGKVFTQVWRTNQGARMEICIALNALTGAEVWATPVDLAHYPNGGVGFDDGPRSTPVVFGDSVYVLGSYLRLSRLDAATGARIWQKDLTNIYGGSVIAWQNAASPVIENDLIFVNANCGADSLMALHTSTGAPVWRSQNEAMTHATPTLATIDGVRQIIFATQSGLVSLATDSGQLLWKHPYSFNYTISLGVSPVVHQDIVFVSGARVYNMGSLAVRVERTNGLWAATRLWATNNPASHWMTPVAHEGFLYGQFGIFNFDNANAQLKCMDIRTGEVKWSTNGFGRCFTLLVDNHLVILTERNQLVLARPNTNAYVELGRFTVIGGYADDANKCWNAPAIHDSRIYLRSTAFAAAFDLLPGLQLDIPGQPAAGKLDLIVRSRDGLPLTPERVSNLSLQGATNPAAPWTPLTNGLVLTNGVVRIPDVDAATDSRKYFIIRENN